MVTQADWRPPVTCHAGWQQIGAAVTSPWLLVVAVVVGVGLSGGGGVGRAAVAARVPTGCPVLTECLLLPSQSERLPVFVHSRKSWIVFQIQRAAVSSTEK